VSRFLTAPSAQSGLFGASKVKTIENACFKVREAEQNNHYEQSRVYSTLSLKFCD